MDGPSLGDMVTGALPLLLIIIAWYFFIRRIGRSTALQVEVLAEMKRQTAIHERIAVALEKRGG